MARHARGRSQFRLAVERWPGSAGGAVEVGPHAVLAPRRCRRGRVGSRRAASAVVASLGPPATRARGVESACTPRSPRLGGGLPVRFEALFAGEERRRISLPGYPFQRERHWIPAPRRRRTGAGHPLLGERHESARGEVAYDTEVLPADPAWLADHRVFGRLLAPGALYGAMAASAAVAEVGGRGSWRRCNSTIRCCSRTTSGRRNDARAGCKCRCCSTRPRGKRRDGSVLSKGADEGWTAHAEANSPRRRRSRGGRSDARPGSLKAADGVTWASTAKVGLASIRSSFRTLQASGTQGGGRGVWPARSGGRLDCIAPARRLLPRNCGGGRSGGAAAAPPTPSAGRGCGGRSPAG